jgi:hypothetical protein
MTDNLALAAAYLSAGGKPPVCVATLAELYRAHADGVPNIVLSPAMKKFFDELLEKKRAGEIANRKETPR